MVTAKVSDTSSASRSSFFFRLGCFHAIKKMTGGPTKSSRCLMVSSATATPRFSILADGGSSAALVTPKRCAWAVRSSSERRQQGVLIGLVPLRSATPNSRQCLGSAHCRNPPTTRRNNCITPSGRSRRLSSVARPKVGTQGASKAIARRNTRRSAGRSHRACRKDSRRDRPRLVGCRTDRVERTVRGRGQSQPRPFRRTKQGGGQDSRCRR